MIAGLVTFGGSYLPAAFYGLVFLSMGQDGGGEPCFDCNRVGRHLLIPVFGPWLEIPDAGAKGKVEWGALGLVQATGIVLSVVGIVFFVRSGKPQSAEAPLSRYALGVVPLPGGGTIGSFRMAF